MILDKMKQKASYALDITNEQGAVKKELKFKIL